jgi:hypothetical protein
LNEHENFKELFDLSTRETLIAAKSSDRTLLTDDSNKQRVDLKKDSLDFLKTQSWEESSKSVFRVNTPEGYEALNVSYRCR